MMSPNELYSRIAVTAVTMSLAVGTAVANPYGFKSPSQVLKGIRTNPSSVPTWKKAGPVAGAPSQARYGHGRGHQSKPNRPYRLAQSVQNQAYSLYISATQSRGGHNGYNRGRHGGNHGRHNGGSHNSTWRRQAISDLATLYNQAATVSQKMQSRHASRHDIARAVRRLEQYSRDARRSLDWAPGLKYLKGDLSRLDSTIRTMKSRLNGGGHHATPPSRYPNRGRSPGIRIPLDKDSGLYFEFRF